MNLLVVSNLYPPDVLGGYEVLARDVTHALRARGHRVSVLTTGHVADGDRDVHRGLELAFPFGEQPSRARLRHLQTAWRNQKATESLLARAGKPDAALVMSQRRLGVGALEALQQAGVPMVWTVNDDWPSAYGRVHAPKGANAWLGALLDHTPLARPLVDKVPPREVVYLTNTIRAQVRAHDPSLPEGLVCSQGVDTSHFSPAGPWAPHEPVRLLFSGRIHPTKSPDACVDTLVALKRRGVKAELYLAGKAADPAYERSLRERAERGGVSADVRWLGYVPRDELVGLYRTMDVFLFLSLWDGEAQGLTPMEAMACGIPVVAHFWGGAREVFDGKGLAEPAARCDGEAGADAVLRVLHHPDEARARIARALGFVRDECTLDRYVDTLAQALARASRNVAAA